MDRRLELQQKLEEILGSGNVYFQPPQDRKLQYPCIVYKLDSAITRFADNNPYKYDKRYQVTYIDRRVDPTIPDKLAMMHRTVFSTWFASDGLNHHVFSTYH